MNFNLKGLLKVLSVAVLAGPATMSIRACNSSKPPTSSYISQNLADVLGLYKENHSIIATLLNYDGTKGVTTLGIDESSEGGQVLTAISKNGGITKIMLDSNNKPKSTEAVQALITLGIKAKDIDTALNAEEVKELNSITATFEIKSTSFAITSDQKDFTGNISQMMIAFKEDTKLIANWQINTLANEKIASSSLDNIMKKATLKESISLTKDATAEDLSKELIKGSEFKNKAVDTLKAMNSISTFLSGAGLGYTIYDGTGKTTIKPDDKLVNDTNYTFGYNIGKAIIVPNATINKIKVEIGNNKNLL